MTSLDTTGAKSAVLRNDHYAIGVPLAGSQTFVVFHIGEIGLSSLKGVYKLYVEVQPRYRRLPGLCTLLTSNYCSFIYKLVVVDTW